MVGVSLKTFQTVLLISPQRKGASCDEIHAGY
jgi:hypothetical protein